MALEMGYAPRPGHGKGSGGPPYCCHVFPYAVRVGKRPAPACGHNEQNGDSSCNLFLCHHGQSISCVKPVVWIAGCNFDVSFVLMLLIFLCIGRVL